MSNDNLDILGKYFSTGSAAQEKEFISDVFVKNNDFNTIVTPQSGSMCLLVGSKGSGKSALLEYWYKECQTTKIPAIMLTPVDVEVGDIGNDTTSLVITQHIYKALVHEVAIKVGSELKGLITQDQENLVNQAIEDGIRQPLLIDNLLRVLMPIGKAVTKVDFSNMLPESTLTVKGNINAINSTLPQDGFFYVLFDDIDQFGNAGSKNYINTIWCAILAFKRLAEKLPNVRAVVTLRNEIWRQITDRRNHERDQIDHVRPMVVSLLPTTDDMKKILKKRLQYCKGFINATTLDSFAPFFEGSDCKIPSSNERRYWEDYLVTSSRDRPRDTVQLVQLLVKDAKDCGISKISDQNVEHTALAYSEQRVDDLVNENSDLCPELEVVIRSFASTDFQLDVEAVKKHLLTVPGWGAISIAGKPLSAGNEDDMFKLWEILYRIEFLNPRAKDNTQSKGYTHIRYTNDSTLVKSTRWNDMQKYIWEIHPCYRSFLLNIKKSNLRGTNLPNSKGANSKHRKKRGR